jgi:hypothetical protein
MDKGQASNNVEGPEPGLSMGEVRVSSLSSPWIESEHEGEQKDRAVAVRGGRRLSRS